MNNLNFVAVMVIIASFGAIHQSANSATIEDIKNEISYSTIKLMGLDATVDTLNLNVNNEFYAKYQNSQNNSFVFVELKPIVQEVAQKPVYERYVSLEQQIQNQEEAIKELKKDKNNNNDDNKDDSNDDNKDQQKDDKDETNDKDITKSDPRFNEKYDSIDWMDGENEQDNMSIEEMDKHLKENEKENETENKESENQEDQYYEDEQ